MKVTTRRRRADRKQQTGRALLKRLRRSYLRYATKATAKRERQSRTGYPLPLYLMPAPHVGLNYTPIQTCVRDNLWKAQANLYKRCLHTFESALANMWSRHIII